MARSNLTVQLRAHATRMLFSGRRASGVEYLQHGERRQARARREVLLAAGAINSPQLLELSGIGDGELLQRLGIPVVARSRPRSVPGCRITWRVDYFYRSRVPTLNNELAPLLRQGARPRCAMPLTRRGPLAMSVNQAGAFVRSRAGLSRPNLHIYFNPASYSTTTLGTKRRLLKPDPYAGFLMSFNTCRPTSRGSTHIRSADPLTPPSIHPNALATEEDIRDVYDGARMLRRIAAAAPLASVTENEREPGAAVSADAEVLQDFRRRSGTVFHASCTCAMGPDPRSAVLDARLRVHGLSGLRVVDAAAFPNVTSGNTNAPTIMLGEKAADLVLQDSRTGVA